MNNTYSFIRKNIYFIINNSFAVICSCHELNYELAQRIADDTATKEERAALPDYKELQDDIRLLIEVARKFKKDRLSAGSLFSV